MDLSSSNLDMTWSGTERNTFKIVSENKICFYFNFSLSYSYLAIPFAIYTCLWLNIKNKLSCHMHEQPLSVEYEILDTCIKATTWHRTDKIQNYFDSLS